MWLWNNGPLPSAMRWRDASSSGRRNDSTLPGWQWSVCSATSTLYFAARRWAASANTMAPKASSPTLEPEANLPPPVETWMMPSDLASANARKAPLMVMMEVTLTAG